MHGPKGAHQLLLHHGGFFGFQNMVCEDPGHGHLDGELDATAHGQLQEELPEPELGQITALLQSLWNADRIHVSPMLSPLGMTQEAAAAALLLSMEHFSRMPLVLNPEQVHAA